MEKKYEIGHDKRIIALRDGPWGVAGTVGGMVDGEHNLSHDGDCWVADNARIMDNARVCENANVFGEACVSQQAIISGDASVYGFTLISGSSTIMGSARAFGTGLILCDVYMSGDSKANTI